MAKNSEKIFKDSISAWYESYSRIFLWELGFLFGEFIKTPLFALLVLVDQVSLRALVKGTC